jgi:hypothetical protein
MSAKVNVSLLRARSKAEKDTHDVVSSRPVQSRHVTMRHMGLILDAIGLSCHHLTLQDDVLVDDDRSPVVNACSSNPAGYSIWSAVRTAMTTIHWESACWRMAIDDHEEPMTHQVTSFLLSMISIHTLPNVQKFYVSQCTTRYTARALGLPQSLLCVDLQVQML